MNWTVLRHRTLQLTADHPRQFYWVRASRSVGGTPTKIYGHRRRAVAGTEQRALRQLDAAHLLTATPVSASYYSMRELELSDQGKELLAQWNAEHPRGG